MNGDLSQGGDGVISGAVVEANVIYGNGRTGGSGINGDGVQNSRIVNNLLYDNHASGISLYQIDGGQPSRNNFVVNNTIVQAADGRWAINIQDGSTGNHVLNNILLTLHTFRGVIDISTDSLSGFVSDYNAVIGRFTTNGGDSVLTLAAWRTATGQDAHSFTTTPAANFVDPSAGDYHIRADSPARDAAMVATDVTTDFEGLARPSGPASDIGADEYHVVTLPPPPPPPAPGRSGRDRGVQSAGQRAARRSLHGDRHGQESGRHRGRPVGDELLPVVRSGEEHVRSRAGQPPPRAGAGRRRQLHRQRQCDGADRDAARHLLPAGVHGPDGRRGASRATATTAVPAMTSVIVK